MKNLLVTLILGLGIGYALAVYTSPVKIEIKEIEKVVVKEGKERIKTVYIREVKSPDGTVITETTEKEEEKTKSSTKSSNETNTVKDFYKPMYSVNLYALTPVTSPVYGLSMHKRFLGPITLGGIVQYKPITTNFDFGLSIGVMF